MITEIKSFILECDNCEDIFEDNSGFSIFPSEDTPNERASDNGWHVDLEKHYCHKCHHFDDNDEFVLNTSRKKPKK